MSDKGRASTQHSHPVEGVGVQCYYKVSSKTTKGLRWTRSFKKIYAKKKVTCWIGMGHNKVEIHHINTKATRTEWQTLMRWRWYGVLRWGNLLQWESWVRAGKCDRDADREAQWAIHDVCGYVRSMGVGPTVHFLWKKRQFWIRSNSYLWWHVLKLWVRRSHWYLYVSLKVDTECMRRETTLLLWAGGVLKTSQFRRSSHGPKLAEWVKRCAQAGRKDEVVCSPPT